jgi:hypothetical protein
MGRKFRHDISFVGSAVRVPARKEIVTTYLEG